MGSWWLIVVGVFFVFGGYRLARARRSRDEAESFLVIYRNPSYPIVVRNAIAVGPIMAAAIILLLVGLLVSRSIAQWLSIPAVLLVELAVVLGFRVPPPFLPGWLLDDIEAGRLEVARPDGGDRVLLVAVSVAVAIWVVAAPAIILAGRFPS